MIAWLVQFLTTSLPPVPSDRDYITTGGQVILAALGLATAVIVWRTEVARRVSKGAKTASEQAVALSAPTGNGFAMTVKEALERIEDTQAQQGKDIGGIRGDIRAERIERMALARVVGHLIEKEN